MSNGYTVKLLSGLSNTGFMNWVLVATSTGSGTKHKCLRLNEEPTYPEAPGGGLRDHMSTTNRSELELGDEVFV